jgi:hypothetical protein
MDVEARKQERKRNSGHRQFSYSCSQPNRPAAFGFARLTMRIRVARSVVLVLVVLVLAGAASLSAAGQTQSPAVPAQAASPKPALPAQAQSVKRAESKKAAVKQGRQTDVRTPQQVDLTIHFK